MSDREPAYNQRYIMAWTVLSIVLGVILFAMFVLGGHFLHAGQIVWNLLRWLARPII